MGVPPGQRGSIGRALVLSAVVTFALGIAFWQGLFGLSEDTRTLVTGALTFVGLTDLGLGIYFLRQSR
jgi:hypothetical protein